MSACVVGGTSGIGLAVATELVRTGLSVTIAGRDPDRGRVAAQRCGARFVAADATSGPAIDRLIKQLPEVPTELVVSGGGVELKSRPARDTPLEDLPTAFELQFTGRLVPVLKFAPLMAERGYGKIVIVSTVAGLAPSRQQWLAGAMAAAAQHACRSLAAEFAGSGVRVNVVALTLVRGSGFDRRRTAGELGPQVSAMIEKLSARLPLGPPTLADAVGTIVNLLAPSSDSITGNVVALGGGLVT